MLPRELTMQVVSIACSTCLRKLLLIDCLLGAALILQPRVCRMLYISPAANFSASTGKSFAILLNLPCFGFDDIFQAHDGTLC